MQEYPLNGTISYQFGSVMMGHVRELHPFSQWVEYCGILLFNLSKKVTEEEEKNEEFGEA
jgi:hypothetical protein